MEPDENAGPIELGRITITYNMGTESNPLAYAIQGLDHVTALGVVVAALDAMREDQKLTWARIPGAEGYAARGVQALLLDRGLGG